jgi:UPF0755 protein
MLETMTRRSDDRHPKERRRGLIILLIVIVLIGGSVAAVGAWYAWATGTSGPQQAIEIVIPYGATGQDVGVLLKEKGVIRSTFAFKILSRFRGFSGGFEAGKYNTLTTNMSINEALEALKKGPFVESVRFSLPEGFNVNQTAERVEKDLGFKAKTFTKAAKSGKFSLPPYLPEGSPTVEGFLFPETYDILKDADVDEVIDRLLAQFKTVAAGLNWSNTGNLGSKITPYDVVIVASMVEREAKFDADRPKIAAVIYNRLKKGMPLQIDATVQYALNKYEPLLLEDLKVDSPYNTYLHKGLPPTPIASPGKASLLAALNPAKANYLYYLVIDDAGHHYFTAGYQDFLRHKATAP